MCTKYGAFKLGSEIFSVENPLTIAEIGTSHNGSIERAVKLIDAAAEAGARAVKFLMPMKFFIRIRAMWICLLERFLFMSVLKVWNFL